MKPQLLEQDKSKKTTIVLADDHKVVRQGLRAVLEANSSFRVIGAAAYVLKDSSVEELVKAVIEAVAGRRYLSPPLSQSAIDAYVQRASTATRDRYDSLSSREREVLQLAAEGHTNAEIGKRLFISPRTVEIHRAN